MLSRTVALLVTSLLLVACSAAPAVAPDPTATAAPAVAEESKSGLETILLYDLKGKPIDFGKLVGKKVVAISFWATFCKPCKSEMPFLQKMVEKYGADGFEVLAISLDTPDTEASVRPFIQKNNYTFQVTIDRQSEATQLLNTKSVLPFLVILDRKGDIVKQKDGFTVGDQPALEELIQVLVAQ
jgi:cytochrome c biogenesis protein CcmG, thiol:disulfide interchange protein DsbE